MQRAVFLVGLMAGVVWSVGSNADAEELAVVANPQLETDSRRAEIVLFDNGYMDPNGGLNLVKYSIADDFEVSVSAMATGASLAMADTDEDLVNWDGVLRWWICADDGSLPGAVLAKGLGVDISWTMLPPTGTWDLYLGSFNFGQSLPLTTGTRYWLALHLNRTWSYNVGLVWNFTPVGHYSPAVSDLISFGDWSPSVSSEFAFSIIASTEVSYIFTDGFELADTSIWTATQP